MIIFELLASTNEIMGQAILASTNEIDVTEELVAAIKADPDLGTGVGGAVTNAATAATEIGKVPRATDPIPAGGQFAWNAVTDTSNKLTLNITEEGA